MVLWGKVMGGVVSIGGFALILESFFSMYSLAVGSSQFKIQNRKSSANVHVLFFKDKLITEVKIKLINVVELYMTNKRTRTVTATQQY